MIEKYKIKFVISLISIIIIISGSIFAMEDRFVSEKEAASTLQNFNSKISQDFKLINLQILQLRYDNLLKSYYEQKRLIKQEPNDSDLKEEFSVIKKEKNDTKSKIDKILELRK